MSTTKPQLHATEPMLGAPMTLSGTDAPSVFGAIAMGVPTPAPVVMPFSLGCATWVNLNAWFTVTSIPTPPNWAVLVPLPGGQNMVGTPLIMQTIFFVPSSLSIAGTNGVRLTFGL